MTLVVCTLKYVSIMHGDETTTVPSSPIAFIHQIENLFGYLMGTFNDARRSHFVVNMA